MSVVCTTTSAAAAADNVKQQDEDEVSDCADISVSLFIVCYFPADLSMCSDIANKTVCFNCCYIYIRTASLIFVGFSILVRGRRPTVLQSFACDNVGNRWYADEIAGKDRCGNRMPSKQLTSYSVH